MAAVAAALVLVAVAVVLAVMLAVRPGSAPPPAVPPDGASSAPGTNSASAPGPNSSTAAAPSAAPPLPPPPPAGTDTPEAGQTPVQPPVIVPPLPGPTQPGPTSPLPGDPFPPALRGRDLTVVPGAGNVVALTFDAGANAAGLPKILTALAARDVAGTFFLTGNWAVSNPDQVRQIMSAGHRVANHSMTHPGFTGLSDALIAQQVLGAEQALAELGADPRPFFRFPYGERDARTIAAVNGLGYVPVRWTVDTLGWKGTSGGTTTQTVADRVLANLQPGEIILMHIGSNPDDGSTLDADALPGIIEQVSGAGYGFTTLDALLGD